MNPLSLLNIVPIQYRLLAAGFFLAVSHTYVYFKGREHGLEKYYEFKSNTETAMGVIHSQNEAVKTELLKLNDEANFGWQAALNELGRRPRIRVFSDCGAREMRGTAAPADKPSEDAGKPASGAERSAPTEVSITEAEGIINGGVKDAAQVLWLIDHALNQQEAYKK